MRWPAALTPTRLRYRIVAVFLGLLLSVQAGSLLLINQGIGTNARAAIDSDLDTGVRIFENLLAQNHRRLQDAARVLASDYGFRSAVASGDAETLVSALQNHGERIDASVALFTDARFKLRAATQDRADSFLTAMRQLAATPEGEGAPPVVLADGEAYQLVVVPVKAPTVIGWVALGFKIDGALLDDMKRLSVTDLVLMSRSGPQAPWQVTHSTLGVQPSQTLVAHWLAARAAAEAGTAGTGPASATAAALHRMMRLNLQLPADASLPFQGEASMTEVRLGQDAGGESVALIVRSLDTVAAPFERLKSRLLGAALVALVAFAIGCSITADVITNPLRSLASSAHRLGHGDYTQPVSVSARDEIGELATAFEAMRQAVRERDLEVRRLAYEDPLTHLPNREQFRTELRLALAPGRDRPRCAVLMLNLDRFKHVNDVLGHRSGDRLLVQVAERLMRDGRLQASDVVARLGGDEFAVLLRDADTPAARELARRIQQSFEQPIQLDDNTVDLSAGIGIASCPEHALLPDTLLSRAEVAMHAAKQQKLGVAVYETRLDTNSDESLSLLSELRTAVEKNQLRLYLQPKIALATGAVLGAEALVRWEHPTRGLIPPMKFIPFAEKTGFIRHLTGWMLARSARVLQQIGDGSEPFKLSVNLSTRDLLDQQLPDKLATLLRQHSLSAHALCLEITESAMMDDPQRALQTLERLHAMGFKLSIDDFGTGYSSLAYLKGLPVDELKIDKSFVLNMENDLDDAKIVRSTIDLAHNLSLSVVAEGVESAKSWKLLRTLGCDEAQGYFVARPMPEALFADWVSQWRQPQVDAIRLSTTFAQLGA